MLNKSKLLYDDTLKTNDYMYIPWVRSQCFYCFYSQDILNNLESCDLEDDDLMLDVDLPEDTPLENGKLTSISLQMYVCERLGYQQFGNWQVKTFSSQLRPQTENQSLLV